MDKTRIVTIIFITKGIFDCIQQDGDLRWLLQDSLPKHYAGNRGDLDMNDGREKEFFQSNHDRLISVFKYKQNRIWIITETDLTETVILLSEEYAKSISLGVFRMDVRQGYTDIPGKATKQ
ncbi:MAG: hypothetical protein KKG02_10790 [Candidatus Edwardsbacteria bacterium]|nr:hypothetical protein [Candidatus Edwardsbacteria bacterium]